MVRDRVLRPLSVRASATSEPSARTAKLSRRSAGASYPDREQTPDGTVVVWTTVLLRFAFGPEVGDLVVHADPKSRTVSIGRITSAYRFEASHVSCTSETCSGC
jgi:predicted Mrr-cat superfamily restriction endonuclease